MARSSATLTQNEVNEFQAFCDLHNIVCDDSAEGQKNGDLLGGVIVTKWQLDITPATLASAYNQIKDHLAHYTPAQQAWNRASAHMSPADQQTIIDYVGRSQHLNSDGENLHVNAAAFANFITEKRIPVQNLEQMVPQIVQSRHRLITKTRLQDSEKAAQAAREAASKQQQPAQNADDDIPSYVPAHLREHYRSMHKPSKRVTPSTEASTMSHFEKLSRDAVASIASNNDRAEAERLLTKVGGGWTWQMVYNSIRIFIDKRNQQRASVGR